MSEGDIRRTIWELLQGGVSEEFIAGHITERDRYRGADDWSRRMRQEADWIYSALSEWRAGRATAALHVPLTTLAVE